MDTILGQLAGVGLSFAVVSFCISFFRELAELAFKVMFVGMCMIALSGAGKACLKISEFIDSALK